MAVSAKLRKIFNDLSQIMTKVLIRASSRWLKHVALRQVTLHLVSIPSKAHAFARRSEHYLVCSAYQVMCRTSWCSRPTHGSRCSITRARSRHSTTAISTEAWISSTLWMGLLSSRCARAHFTIFKSSTLPKTKKVVLTMIERQRKMWISTIINPRRRKATAVESCNSSLLKALPSLSATNRVGMNLEKVVSLFRREKRISHSQCRRVRLRSRHGQLPSPNSSRVNRCLQASGLTILICWKSLWLWRINSRINMRGYARRAIASSRSTSWAATITFCRSMNPVGTMRRMKKMMAVGAHTDENLTSFSKLATCSSQTFSFTTNQHSIFSSITSWVRSLAIKSRREAPFSTRPALANSHQITWTGCQFSHPLTV